MSDTVDEIMDKVRWIVYEHESGFEEKEDQMKADLRLALAALVAERDEAKRNLQFFLGKSNTLRSDLAADVRRLTVERDEARAERDAERQLCDRLAKALLSIYSGHRSHEAEAALAAWRERREG